MLRKVSTVYMERVDMTVTIESLSHEVREIHEQFPTWTRDNAFVHWFVQAFLVEDPEAAAACVTGVSHDKGVDGIYIDDNMRKVFIVQGKFLQGAKPPSTDRQDVISFAQLARKLTGPDRDFRPYLAGIDPRVGTRMKEARERIRKRDFELNLYFVTTGKCSGALRAEGESEVNQVQARAELSIADRHDVLALLTDYLSGAAPPVPCLDLPIDTSGAKGGDGVSNRYDPSTRIESWIITMSGRDLGGLYAKAGDRLFARNIRGFLGDTKINDGMSNTLKREPWNFWYFNNGVTMVCSAARMTTERGTAVLRVNNPQIINGQQTTRMLDQEHPKRASVLVRVISVPREREGGQEAFEGLVSNIVAATNWQNAILPSDLRANDGRQVALQREFAKLKYHYLRKRQTKKEAKRLLGKQHWWRIKKDELAQVVGACELDPYEVRGGKEGLFEPPFYGKIFDGRSIRQYLSMYWIGRVVKRAGSGYPDRAYAKWHTMYFLWSRVGVSLKGRARADAFRELCERGRWPSGLEQAAAHTYRALMAFYRLRGTKGEHATDVSNFFYRPHQHTRFSAYWKSRANTRRAKFAKALRKFEDELDDYLAE